jgi:hypothetical protein
MATLLFYHSPIFSLIMVGVGAEDPELGCSIGLLAASCWQGVLYGARSSDSCGVLVGALIEVLWMFLERLISLEVQLVKLFMIQCKKCGAATGHSHALPWATVSRKRAEKRLKPNFSLQEISSIVCKTAVEFPYSQLQAVDRDKNKLKELKNPNYPHFP